MSAYLVANYTIFDMDSCQSIKHFRHESSKDGYVAFCNGLVMPDGS